MIKTNKRMPYTSADGFLDMYANIPEEDYKFKFSEFLDNFYLLSDEDKVEFMKGIDFYKVDDSIRRSKFNSAVRQLILDRIPSSFNVFRDYYTEEFIQKDPVFPPFAKDKLRMWLLLTSLPQYTANNLRFGNDVLERR